MKNVIVTDSVATIAPELIEELNIKVVPLTVVFGQETFLDNIEITASEFFQRMAKEDQLPKTSQPSVGQFTELYEELLKEYDNIISIHLPQNLSGTIANAASVANSLAPDRIHVLDSRQVALAEGFIVAEAARMNKSGASIEEITARVKEMSLESEILVVPDTLENLIKGGRVSSLSGGVANLLKIKPIISIYDGTLDSKEKVRTHSRAIKRLDDYLDKVIKEAKHPLRIDVMHSESLKAAQGFKERAEARHPELNLNIYDIAPVVGTHTGSGAVAFAYARDYSVE